MLTCVILTALALTSPAPESAEALWSARKRYFFKPAGGHGGKAVYRGDKMTRGVWEEVQRGGYIAQELAAPTERRGSRHFRSCGCPSRRP